MAKKINFALIGSGRMGERWVDVFSRQKNNCLVAIVNSGSNSAKVLAAKLPGCIATAELSSVLNDPSIDAVVVATPHSNLAPISHKALLCGKHVLCEKPAGIKSIEIKRNTTLAKKKNLTYMVGYNHRFHDGFMKAFQLYNKGSIGEIIFIRAKYGFGGREGYDKEWRLNKTLSGGGHLIDMGVHMIDLASLFLGKDLSVKGFLSDTFWKKGSEDNAFVLLQNKNGATASIHTSLTQWKPTHVFEIYGKNGYLIIEGLGPRYGDGERLIVGSPVGFTGEVKERVVSCNQERNFSLEGELEEFVSGIKEHRDTSPSSFDAYETLRIVEKVYKNNKL